jgi:hypothetical protein
MYTKVLESSKRESKVDDFTFLYFLFSIDRNVDDIWLYDESFSCETADSFKINLANILTL